VGEGGAKFMLVMTRGRKGTGRSAQRILRWGRRGSGGERGKEEKVIVYRMRAWGNWDRGRECQEAVRGTGKKKRKEKGEQKGE